MSQGLKTGELAKLAGVGVETLRFYERRGLLAKPGRTPSGYRQYPSGDVERVRFIRRARDLGFSLAEIRHFFDLASEPGGDCVDLCDAVDAKLEELERQIQELQSKRRALAKLRRECPECVPIEECLVLSRLREAPDRVVWKSRNANGRG
ncbi:MAG TPA: heavy metal-responsive transcriptional regulator [Candidatus Eisenbacteria bacterium]|nr:heavy metal-responsive transcriptional regulator [Candidatus Eisenbacteria bacterium]